MLEKEMDTCCYKALKHGELFCPVCGLSLQQMINITYNQHTL